MWVSWFTDGYSVKDIKYRWQDGKKESVGISSDVQLPTFKVIAIRTLEKLEVLTTGEWWRDLEGLIGGHQAPGLGTYDRYRYFIDIGKSAIRFIYHFN